MRQIVYCWVVLTIDDGLVQIDFRILGVLICLDRNPWVAYTDDEPMVYWVSDTHNLGQFSYECSVLDHHCFKQIVFLLDEFI